MRCQLGGEGLESRSHQRFGMGFSGVLNAFYSAAPWNGRDCNVPLVLLTPHYTTRSHHRSTKNIVKFRKKIAVHARASLWIIQSLLQVIIYFQQTHGIIGVRTRGQICRSPATTLSRMVRWDVVKYR